MTTPMLMVLAPLGFSCGCGEGVIDDGERVLWVVVDACRDRSYCECAMPAPCEHTETLRLALKQAC